MIAIYHYYHNYLIVRICKMELFEQEWNAYLFNFLTMKIKHLYDTQRNRGKNYRNPISNMEIRMEYRGCCENPYAYSIREYPSFFALLCKRQDLTTEMIFKMMKMSHMNLDWGEISANPAITMDDVEKHIDLSWDFERLSENPNMTAKMFRTHPTADWNMEQIVLNPFLGDKRQFLDYKVKNTFLISIHEHINDVANYKTASVCKCSVIELVFADIHIVKIMAKN